MIACANAQQARMTCLQLAKDDVRVAMFATAPDLGSTKRVASASGEGAAVVPLVHAFLGE